MLGRVEAGAARRDPPLGRDAGHLGIDQPRAALGALAQVDEVPVGGRAVHRLVLRHGRDDDPVHQLHVAQAEGRSKKEAAQSAARAALEKLSA